MMRCTLVAMVTDYSTLDGRGACEGRGRLGAREGLLSSAATIARARVCGSVSRTGARAVSHRATDARRSTMRVRMNRARVALRPSPSTPTTVLVAESTPPTVGAADRPLRGAFSASRPSPAPLSETRPPARRSRRPDATPHRVSPRTMGGSRNSGRAVGGGGLGSVRLPPTRRVSQISSRSSRRGRRRRPVADADPPLPHPPLSPTQGLARKASRHGAHVSGNDGRYIQQG